MPVNYNRIKGRIIMKDGQYNVVEGRKSIDELDLHEETILKDNSNNEIFVLRVLNGWIYTQGSQNVFVPGKI